MTHGQAAQDPEHHRVSECVCLRLAKEFEQSRNRPKDTRGKTLPIPQSIVSVYSHIRQLLEDSRVIVVQTALALEQHHDLCMVCVISFTFPIQPRQYVNI